MNVATVRKPARSPNASKMARKPMASIHKITNVSVATIKPTIFMRSNHAL